VRPALSWEPRRGTVDLMSWHVVCPACGDGVVIAGGADTAAGEIVMRRNEGEVVVRIRYTGGPFTD